MTILVDSDILIEVSRGNNLPLIQTWINLSISGASILFSPVSVAELWAGMRPKEEASLSRMFEALICVPVDAQAGRRAGMYMNRFAKSHGVELGDALIAATAIAANALLWTRNRKHYPMSEITFFEPPA